ncbi:protein mesa [Chrysochromulina tobinii]|uniref:Protein mesa n=1 Tax=Chrysochromulina tobinii TaxID=1460289 RepID=A0A0M0LPY6_9EUKA|nr:protein mesa [Chrysochromulina tobinii]|eukprot:KOO53099.1 protein mesa [Chrysochromulina sp. CCMP291]
MAEGGAVMVEAVMMAEFDIDKGSVCRIQYPRDVGDKHLLAELMLPEGAHNHFEDWTVFMLGGSADMPSITASSAKPTTELLRKRWTVHAYRYNDDPNAEEQGAWEIIRSPSPNPEQDSPDTISLELGGTMPTPLFLVIDLGDGQTLRFVHHEELQYAALQPDFASMYSLEGAALGIHFLAAEDQEEFRVAIETLAAASAAPQPLLWCLNHVSSRRDATVRRGAQVKALAVCSRFQFIHVWKPVLVLAVDRMFMLSTGLGEYSETLEQQCRYLYDELNALSVSALPPPEEIADASVTELLRRFRTALICIFHAVLNKKRVLFLGHSQPAEIVCLAVLSLPLLVCPPLTGLLERCYPFVSLTNLDFLKIEGFIAGSTNPIFASHPEWWDVLCDLDSGRVLVSSVGPHGRKCAAEPPRLSELDEDLYEQVSTGLDARYSEHWLRACFQEHAQQLRCEQLRGSTAVMDRQAGSPSDEMVMLFLEQLRSASCMTDKELEHIFSSVHSFVADEARLEQLLSRLPGSSPLGCLSPVATALFHPNASVRNLAASLLRAIGEHKAANPLMSGLNSFLLLGLSQQEKPDRPFGFS